MMYPYMTLSDGTEIIHSHLITEKNKISLKLSIKRAKYSISEGIGFIPDIWALNTLDIMKNLWRITEDYELKN